VSTSSEPRFEQHVVEQDGARLEVVVGTSPGPLLCTTHPFMPPQANTTDTLSRSGHLFLISGVARSVGRHGVGGGRAGRAGACSPATGAPPGHAAVH
jgi:hypothetical protein